MLTARRFGRGLFLLLWLLSQTDSRSSTASDNKKYSAFKSKGESHTT